MNTRSLSFRLVTWYAGVLTLVFILLGALTIILLRDYLESNVLDTQARRARQIADTLVAAASRTGDVAMAREVEELYAPEANERFIRITRGDGHVVYASGPPHDDSFDPATVPALTLPRPAQPALTRAARPDLKLYYEQGLGHFTPAGTEILVDQAVDVIASSPRLQACAR